MATTSRRPKLEYTVDSPLNREPPVKGLISSFITEEGAYDRNHGPVPHLDRESYRVKVDGAVRNPVSLSIHELSDSFPQHTLHVRFNVLATVVALCVPSSKKSTVLIGMTALS